MPCLPGELEPLSILLTTLTALQRSNVECRDFEERSAQQQRIVGDANVASIDAGQPLADVVRSAKATIWRMACPLSRSCPVTSSRRRFAACVTEHAERRQPRSAEDEAVVHSTDARRRSHGRTEMRPRSATNSA